MQITTITVHYQETRSLPGYSNVQPSVGLTAQLAPGEDAQATVNALLAECRATVRAEIDATLVANGCQPHYARPVFGAQESLGFTEDEADDESAEPWSAEEEARSWCDHDFTISPQCSKCSKQIF